MKILHFYKTTLPASKGGVEVFIDSLCKSTADLGVKNTVLSLADQPSSQPICFSKYQVVQAKQNLYIASTGFSLSAFAKFRKLITQADIVHYHFPNPFADILHFTCRVKKPTIVTYHSDIIKQKWLLKLYKPLMARFMKSIDHVIATSPNYFATSDILQKFSHKVTVIPAGINKKNYPNVSEDKLNYWQRRLPKPFFLFIGVMRYYKALHIALDAVKDTDIQLVLGGSGGIEDELKTYAKQNGLDNVHFLGDILEQDKVALLRLCYGFVFPSHLRSEAFGISLLEAAAFGKPMISCEIGTGTSFININKKTGLVIEPSSAEALRKAMQYLLQNPVCATKFGKNAQKRFYELFTSDVQAQAYVYCYKKLLEK